MGEKRCPENGNSYNRYAVTVEKENMIIGRVPKELSKIFWNSWKGKDW